MLRPELMLTLALHGRSVNMYAGKKTFSLSRLDLADFLYYRDVTLRPSLVFTFNTPVLSNRVLSDFIIRCIRVRGGRGAGIRSLDELD